MSEVLLNDICELIVDCPHTTAVDEGHGYPLVRTPNIGKGRLVYNGMHRVSEEVYNKRNFRAVPQEDDLIFAREATAGNVALIQKGEKVCLGQRTVLLRPNKALVNPKFLTYFLLAPEQQYNLLCTANGATVAHVNMSTIRNLKLELPHLQIQIKIGIILSRYDSLIENYQKQIKLLEESAQRLYKEWFIDLRFPGHENTKIVDGIPEGWEKKKINEIALLKAGGDKPEIVSENRTKICNIPIYSNGTSNEGLYGYTDKPEITEYCITISARGSVGYTVMRRKPFVPIVRLISVIPQSIYVGYLYFYIKQIPLDSNGAAQQQITIPMIRDKEIIIPTNFILDELERCLEPMFKHIDDLKSQIRHLTEARDRLLPKLINRNESLIHII